MSDASPRPWRLTGETIRDAEGVVVVSMFNPADMETRRLIVDAVNARGDTPGNAAALREALGNVRDIVRELADEVDQLEEVDLVCNTDQAGRIEALFREALRIAKAALSAPPRNCDMFRTVDEAFAACHDDRGYISDPVAERRSTISFMLSDAPKTPKLEQRDGALPDGLFEPAQEVQGGKQ